MWRRLLITSLLLAAAARAGTGTFPVVLAIMNDCERCAEPFFEPTFGFKVVEGTWPEKGILRCKSAGTLLECEGGLKLSIERITFH